MDTSVVTALAAAVSRPCWRRGWRSGRRRARWLAYEITRLQDLYRQFIEEASTCYVDALQHNEPDIAGLVRLYAKLGRMRTLSSSKVLECAGRIERQIIETYLVPDKSFLELREVINSKSVDLLGEFSATCRAEFDSLRAKQF